MLKDNLGDYEPLNKPISGKPPENSGKTSESSDKVSESSGKTLDYPYKKKDEDIFKRPKLKDANLKGVDGKFYRDEALDINLALKTLEAPFFMTCSHKSDKKKLKPSTTWRKRIPSCDPKYPNIRQVGEKEVGNWLRIQWGASIRELKRSPSDYSDKIFEKVMALKKKNEEKGIKSAKIEMAKPTRKVARKPGEKPAETHAVPEHKHVKRTATSHLTQEKARETIKRRRHPSYEAAEIVPGENIPEFLREKEKAYTPEPREDYVSPGDFRKRLREEESSLYD